MHSLSLLALAGGAAAQIRGFNYGALFADYTARTEQDFVNDFNAAKNLPGTAGFTSARLFTMIQGYTENTVISAIPAAISTNTSLLLGLWASSGPDAFNQELTALRNAINQYGTAFTDLVVGISVGSEDLYRISPTGIENESGPGASPDQLVSYIQQVRSAISGTAASQKTIGHVDTWTAYVNGSNAAVIEALDWVGVDAYPFYQTVNANGIENGESLFFDAYNATVGVAQGKPVWITETGWPVTGAQSGAAIASVENAETYWKDVACRVLGSDINLFWYLLNDGQTDQSATSFKIVGTDLTAPLFDLSCPAVDAPVSTTAASTAPGSTASATSATSAEVSVPTAPNTPAVSTTPSAAVPTAVSTIQPQPTTLVTATSRATSAPAPSVPTQGPGCPASLSGSFEYPHLLVPVDSANPSKAYGTQYNATISSTVSSIFNFDIRPEFAGKTCSLVFLFPEQKDLTTSSFDYNGKGSLLVTPLAAPATEQTTFANKTAAAGSDTCVAVAPGNTYTLFTGPCAAGQRIAYEFSGTDGLDVEYFQDYNLPGIGAYVTVC